MSLSNLSSAQLAHLIGLVKEKESLQSKLDHIIAELKSIETGKAVPKKRGRKPGRPAGVKSKVVKGRKAKRGKRQKAPFSGAVRRRFVGHHRQGTGREVEGQTRQHFQLVLYDRQKSLRHQEGRRSEVFLFVLGSVQINRHPRLVPRCAGTSPCEILISRQQCKFHYCAVIGNGIASASTFPSATWERDRRVTSTIITRLPRVAKARPRSRSCRRLAARCRPRRPALAHSRGAIPFSRRGE